jgi:hypothetical protein
MSQVQEKEENHSGSTIKLYLSCFGSQCSCSQPGIYEPGSNAKDSLKRGVKGTQRMQTSNYFFDNLLTHIQLNEFDSQLVF